MLISMYDEYGREVSEMERVQLHLREDQLRELRKIREKKGVMVSESIRRAVDYYLADVLGVKVAKKRVEVWDEED